MTWSDLPSLSLLKGKNIRGYEKLMKEIEKYKKALNYVDEFIDSDDEALCQALENTEKQLNAKTNDNLDCTIPYKKLKKEDKSSSKPTLQSQYGRNVTKSKYVCSCGKTYRHRQNLYRHRKKCISHQSQSVSERKVFPCRHCGIPFDDYESLVSHIEEQHPLRLQSGAGNVSSSTIHPTSSTLPQKNLLSDGKSEKKRENKKSALNNSVQSVEIYPQSDSEKFDLLLFFAKSESEIINILNERRRQTRNIKFYINVRVRMVREIATEGDTSTTPHFRCKSIILLENEDLTHDLNSAFHEIIKHLEEFINKGSDWRMDEVISMEIVTVPYTPLGGSSYLTLPPEFRGIRSVVNIRNTDQKCFLWSVLASLHPAAHHSERVNHYVGFEKELNMQNIDIPVPLSKIPKFEAQNAISVNVFGMEDGEIFPLYLSKLDISRHEVDLLYLKNNNNAHYCLIKDFNKFLCLTKKAKIRHYFCRRCLHGFTREDLMQEHLKYCKQFDFQHVTYPEEGKDDILEFTNYFKQLRVPFVIYADFETLVEKIDRHSSKLQTSKHDTHFEPCGYAYKVVCCNENYSKPPTVYRGENAVEHFLENLLDEEEDIKDILSDDEPLIMNNETERAFRIATECHICKKAFSDVSTKVRDHYHIGVTGDINAPDYSNYRGAACQECNLSFREPNFIPVIFHNLRGFDGHLLCQAVGKYKDKEIKCIAQNMNRYISTSLGDLRFIDSFQFMTSSLERLVDNLSVEGLSNFKHFRKTFQDDKIAKLLLRKNVYCYDYVDSFNKFQERQLPPKEAFYNGLKNEHISDEDYAQVQAVLSSLNMKTLGDLHDNYVLTDVLLLADVFEKFRDMTLDYYGLDACHYFTAPGLAWDAALKMTDVCLDLITDPLMYNFFESGLRGGVSVISKKLSTANNPYVQGYDPNKPRKYLMYYDANNLYGGVMRMPLPTGMFRWLTEDEISNFDVHSISANSKTGFTLEVDLEYPDELHDEHNCYPLAPEHKTVMDEEISPYNGELWKLLYPKTATFESSAPKSCGSKRRVNVSKLIPTLEDKSTYILHYQNLKLYLNLGLKCKKIHRILEYRQEAWLQPYIDFNSNKRKYAKNEFEKDFLKLMNNSVFGKTMENLRNRVDIKLIQTEKKIKKYCAKPSFQRVQIFNEDLVGVENKKVKLFLNKPVYVGQTILDLSKAVIYDFHYNVMKTKYGDNVQLLFTDTDSLMYEIQTDDIYQDMAQQKHLYDLSEYPTNHPLYDVTNKKVVLRMKDECKGLPIKEFIGLRSKMYSVLMSDSTEKRTAKGVSKCVIKKQLHHDIYKQCLLEKTKTLNEMMLIRSDNHQLYMDKITKVGLCSYDEKRYIKECGIDSYSYGHYKIRDELTKNLLCSLMSH